MEARIETSAAPSTRTARLGRSVLLAGAAIGALVVVALVLAVALPRTPVTYPAGSPEAAFQEFYAAWETGDIEAAYRQLSPGATADMDLAAYRRLEAEQSWQRQQDRRLVLEAVDITGDRAVIQLRVDEFSGGGIGAQRSSYDRAVRLVRQGGSWLIDEPLVGIESVSHAY